MQPNEQAGIHYFVLEISAKPNAKTKLPKSEGHLSSSEDLYY